MPVATDKERAIEAIRTLPDNATFDEAIDRLSFIAKIQEGLRQSKAGLVVSYDEIKNRFRV